ncbi:unnamed protein product [Lampetra planeri]
MPHLHNPQHALSRHGRERSATHGAGRPQRRAQSGTRTRCPFSSSSCEIVGESQQQHHHRRGGGDGDSGVTTSGALDLRRRVRWCGPLSAYGQTTPEGDAQHEEAFMRQWVTKGARTICPKVASIYHTAIDATVLCRLGGDHVTTPAERRDGTRACLPLVSGTPLRAVKSISQICSATGNLVQPANEQED